ncbi:MAG: hypothetical protein HGB18_00155 [Candidatus Moranbacteria bacterium]|nr:hypothetical protein [Candidatus Moranbacteria bacterium]
MSSLSNARGGDARRERMAEYRRLQSQSVILEQDLRKKRRRHDELVDDIRRLKKEMVRLDTELRERQSEEARAAKDLGVLEIEASRTRKRMNLLA